MVSPMNIYLSHSTALAFWRSWSSLRPIPLRVFHDLRRATAALLPIGSYPSTTVVRASLTQARDVRDCIRAAADAPGMDAAARSALAAATAAGPIHILVGAKRGLKNTGGIVRHHVSAPLPRQSLVKIADGLYVCSPELVFLQMAGEIPFGALLALGYELCGSYPAPSASGAPLVRRPLASPERLAAFAARARNFKGVAIARTAARQIQAKSASPMETELAALAFTLVSRGGLGIEPAQLNEPVALSPRATAATGLKRVVCDLFWPRARYAIEYDGHDAHRDRRGQARDSRKRDALLIDGIELVTVTSSQFHHVNQCISLLDDTARRIGRPKRKRRPEHLAKHLDLRRQMRAFHREHLLQREDARPGTRGSGARELGAHSADE